MEESKSIILPFIDYVNSDKSEFPYASDITDPRTGRTFIDEDNDFLVGRSGGFLMNWNFRFINTHLFTEVGKQYETNVKNSEITSWIESLPTLRSENRNKYYYCPYLSNTVEYDDFWRRETTRRRNGMTAPCRLTHDGKIIDLHISGDFYNYLNYGRILRTPNDIELAELHSKGDYKTKQISAFPRFWDGDYWNFKTDLFLSNNGYHLAKAKARGKGYSYKRGSQGANTINLVANATIILAAWDISYLTDPGATADMLKTNLDWYEENTHWKRFYISESLDSIELGFRTKKGGNKKFGMKSKALSVSLFNNPSAPIGKRALEIDYEESGKLPNLEDSLDVTLSSTEVGSGNVGTIRCYGTAGVKGADWRPFSNVFYNPSKYGMMPFENIWDDNMRLTTCGFFHPQVLNMEPYMDKDGNSLLESAYISDLDKKKLAAENMTTDKWMMFVGQRANKPSEAFKSVSTNLFSSPGLSKHIQNLQANLKNIFYRDGMLFEIDKKLIFKTNLQLLDEGLKQYVHNYIEQVPFDPKKDFYGCIREFYPPFKVDSVVPDNLYYIVFDSIGKDKKSELVIGKNSLNSVHVMMYPNNETNTTGDICVAAYTGRPDTMEEVNRIVLFLSEYYNAKVLAEVDRGTIVSDFRKWRKLHRLATDPTEPLNNKQVQGGSANYGVVIGEGDNATEALIYLKEWLYTKRSSTEDGDIVYNYHYVSDLPSLYELESFNLIGNFDRISSLRLAPYMLKVRLLKRKNESSSNRSKASIYEQIGLYNYRD